MDASIDGRLPHMVESQSRRSATGTQAPGEKESRCAKLHQALDLPMVVLLDLVSCCNIKCGPGCGGGSHAPACPQDRRGVFSLMSREIQREEMLPGGEFPHLVPDGLQMRRAHHQTFSQGLGRPGRLCT
jgi:hypothetical protein